tara:strand:- start:2015 stop:2881 length:867 start_codon:yes stop_codon:yes gene_type:complete
MSVKNEFPEYSKVNILIVGTIRDVAGSIAKELTNISNAFSGSNKVKFILVESDSKDNTANEINKLRSDLDITLIEMGHLEDRMPLRTERIAECRNAYLKVIEKDEFSSFDLVVVADLDGVNLRLKKESVLKLWQTDVPWDVCFGNPKGRYYDLWALRHTEWCPGDCWVNYKTDRINRMNKFQAYQKNILSKMLNIPKDNPPILVSSAFGGLGIYRRIDLVGLRYQCINDKGGETCEHVSINSELTARGKKLYIMPFLENSGSTEAIRYTQFPYGIVIKFLSSVARFIK